MGGVIGFEALDARQRRVAGYLQAAGLRSGDRVAVLSANRTEMLETTMGALRAGIVPVPISPLLTPAEIAYVVEDSGCEILISDRMIGEEPGLRRVVTFGDAYERCLHEAEPASLADVTLTRPMHYTSGTTGRSKGVWIPPQSESDAIALSEDFAGQWDLRGDDVHLVCSPLTHSAPHRFALRTLEAGGTVVLRPRFEAAETLPAIELFGVTSTFMVPTHLERILAQSDATLRRHDLSSLRLLAHAGAPIREATKRAAIELFPRGSVWEFYGSTEGGATRISTEEWLARPGSVGRPRAGARILIADPDGDGLETGEVGQVWIDDPMAERFEYWGDPAKTQRAWQGSAFSVGDLGHLDRDGYLYLDGRRDDVIISGGVNVYPQEVEDVLADHPAVAEALVYGAPHDEWGEQVSALVVPEFGAPLDPEKLRAWARERLAGYKCPRAITLVDELPRTSTGKLKRVRPAT